MKRVRGKSRRPRPTARPGVKESARSASLTLALVFLVFTSLFSQQPKPSQNQVEAVYLYNFGKFIEWPSKADAAKGDAFAICILGQDPFGSVLDSTLSGENIAGRNVVAKRISKPLDAASCRIVFIGLSEESRLKEVLDVARSAAVLTVSDLPEFLRRGGMMQFVLEGDKVRFEVNLAATEEAGLTLSSQLLKVARAVKRKPGE